MFRYFENLIDPFAAFDPATPPSKLVAYLRTQYTSLRPFFFPLFATGVLTALIEAGLVFYAGRLVDLLTSSTPANLMADHGVELVAVALLILFARPGVFLLQKLFLEQMLAGNMQEQARWRAHKHLLGQSSSFFQNDFAGRLTNRVMQLGGAVEDIAYMAFEALWFAVTFVIGAAIILASINPILAVPLLIWVIFYGLFVYVMSMRVGVASEKWSDARSMVTARIVDAYSNVETVKLFARDGEEERYVLSALRRLRLRFQRFLRLMTKLDVRLNALNSLLLVGMAVPAVWLWSRGAITVGDCAAAIALSIRVNSMSGWIMWVMIQMFEQAGVVREGLRSISVPHSVTDVAGAPALKLRDAAISFEEVSHHYGKGQGGLSHVTLTIPAGQKVGLVGPSGAGKSSLVNLLLRFRDAEQGRILIDGQDVSRVTQTSVRQAIGMVSQDSSLLHRSVRANILYGHPDAREAQMIAAAKRAEAHDFIQDLVDPQGRTGYDAHVGERGVKLSGGQRQRVALARVILKDAPILVLDEATSALDSEVEAMIQQTLFGLMEGKTVIAIAHRLSTISQMDRIVVMDRGQIVEDGTHKMLMANDGLYARLWSRQSGGFIGEAVA